MIFSMNKSNFMSIDTAVLFALLCLLITIVLFIVSTKIFKDKTKRIMRIWSLGWFIVTIILFSCGVFGRFVDVDTINSKEYTKKELTQDLQQLEKYIMKDNPLYFTDKEKVRKLFSSAYGKIEDDMTELEFYRLINPIVAAVGCGHTNLSISEALVKNREETSKFFPLKITLVGNQLYVLEDDISNSISAGDEIKSINGKTSDEIIKILIENISGDSNNEAKPRYIISKNFNSKFYDFVDNSDKFHVVLIDKKGISRTVDLQAKFVEEYNTSAWKLHFTSFQDGNYYENKIYKDYAVLTINVFMQEKDNKFDTFLDQFFLKLNNQNISKLIIDVRGNYGGNPNMSQALLSHLITEKIDYFNSDLPFLYNLMGYQKPVSPSDTTFVGNIVVLTNGACFSTTGHFCALMKYHNLATLVGSETGGTYICTDSSKDTVLNHTRIRLHYSTLTYNVSVEGISEYKGIEPNINVSPTIEDILNNKDVQMELGLQALGL